MMPLEIRERIEKAFESAPEGFTIDYMPHGQVLCKLCGKEIQKMRKIGRNYAMIPSKDYREITMHFENGDHITNLCQPCVETLDEDLLEKVYCADIVQWDKEGLEDWSIVKVSKPKGVD